VKWWTPAIVALALIASCGGEPEKAQNAPEVVDRYRPEGLIQQSVVETSRQLATLDLRADVPPDWLPYVRVNFTLADG
jgi:hypothetical protein